MPGDPGASRAEADELAAGSYAPPEPLEPRSASATARSWADLVAVLSALPAPRTTTGTGTITAVVTTRELRPLEGVRVSALPVVDEPAQVSWDGQPVEAELRCVAERRRREKALGREAVTGPDGTCALSGLTTGPFSMDARLAGYEITREDAAGAAVSANATVRFVAVALGRFRVSILLPDGRSPGSAKVRLAQYGSVVAQRTWTPARPELEVRPGSYDVRVTSGDEWTSPQQAVTVRAGPEVPALAFVLAGRTRILGRVVIPEDEVRDRSCGINVYMAPVRPGPVKGSAADQSEWLRRAGKSTAAFFPDLSFRFDDVSPGSYVIGVERDLRELELSVAQTIEVGRGLNRVELTVPPVDRTDAIVVTVLGPGGVPVRNASLEIAVPEEMAPSGDVATSVVAKKDGTYWIVLGEALKRVFLDSDAAHGTARVSVTAPGFGARTVELPREPGSDLLVELLEPATLSVAIKGYSGSGLEGELDLTLFPLTESDPDRRVAPDVEGHALLGPVEPGERDVVLLARGTSEDQPIPVRRVHVKLSSGRNELTIEPPRLFRVGVQTDGKGRLYLTSPEPPRRAVEWPVNLQVETSASGHGVFERVPAGDYIVGFESEDEKHLCMPMRISESVEVHFAPCPFDALVFCADDETAAALLKAGLEPGDLVLSIDGREPRDGVVPEQPEEAGEAPARASLAVLRGGTVRTIEIERDVLQQASGSFEPAYRPR